ncbi:MAG: 50S ribosomal protein L7/L12 [Armatimonadetes bacterium]|nr:50S ribosomal protein L7/L12 [Armatimonadota bacterium]
MAITIDKIVDDISKLNGLELSDLKKALEDKFDVTAAAPMAGMPMMMPSATGEAAAEEQTEFEVRITEIGGQKLQVIKVVRAITGLGLKEAKELVDGTPNTIKENVGKDEAEDIKKQVEEVGATVEIK